MPTLNLGILAHVDAGKTSLTERLLYAAGVIDHVGRVDDGDTQTDTLALERQRGITIRSAVTSFLIGDLTVNLIDTPGHPDFIAEVERVLDVLDGVVLVISAVEGVQAQTRVLMRALHRLGVPVLIFVNKIDRAGARPGTLVAEIGARLGVAVLPLGTVTDAGTRAAGYRPYAADQAFLERQLEVLSRQDDALLSAYVDSGLPDRQRLRDALVRQTARSLVHPVLFGSAMTGAGVPELMTAIAELLPAVGPPTDAGAGGVGEAVVFKIDRGPTGEKTCYVRVLNGSLRPRAVVDLHRPDGRRVEGVRITAVAAFGRARELSADRLEAGQIGTVRGLAEARIGDLISTPVDGARQHPDDRGAGQVRAGSGGRRLRHHFTPPSLETVVHPVRPADRGRLRVALDQLAEQDPLINVRQDDLRAELSVSLYGEVQKEVIEATLINDFGVPVRFAETSTICVERPLGVGSAVELMRGEGNPFLATIGLRVEPAPVGSGVRFAVETAVHGTMPPAFFKAVEDTVLETAGQALHGWQLVDALITLTHTGYAPRQSHAHQGFSKSMSSTGADFRDLTPLVLMAALREAGTVVLEPIHRIRLELPTDVLPAVYPVLAAHRVLPGAPVVGETVTVIDGDVPAAEIHGLEQEIPGLTRGEGVLESRFDRYQAVVGRPPERSRTDRNPLDRAEYLLRATRGKGAMV